MGVTAQPHPAYLPRLHASTPSLIATAKLNDVDPRGWLADVMARIADHPAPRLRELLPWRWTAAHAAEAADAA